jgi:hypothetical protein
LRPVLRPNVHKNTTKIRGFENHENYAAVFGRQIYAIFGDVKVRFEGSFEGSFEAEFPQ